MATREEIVAEVRRYLGTPFRHQGRTPGQGLDCAGVPVCAARALGLADYDFAGYGAIALEPVLALHGRAAGFRPVAPELAQPGDVVVIRFSRALQHVAVLTDLGILHAHARVGRVVEHRLDAAWRARIGLAFAFPGF